MGDVVSLPKASPQALERGDHVELGQRLVAHLRTAGPIIFAEGEPYRYDGRGLWRTIERAAESRFLQSLAGIEAGVGKTATPLKIKASDVAGAIQLAHDQLADADFFATAPTGLVFANGFVRVTAEGVTLEEHSAEQRARYAYGFEYAPEGSPSRCLGFFAEVFRDDADAEQKIRCLQEFGGASLLGIAPRYQRALVLVGEGANGKSRTGDLLEGCMPEGATCAIPPQKWEDEYRLAMLAGKRLNIVSELPEADIVEGEIFKAVISGDATTARHIRQAPFCFRPAAGHLFAANRLPGTNDQSHGFWRRLIVIGFNRIFEKDEQNAQIAIEILEAERPQIVSWLLDGAVTLLRRGQYTLPESSELLVKAWRQRSNQVAAFIDEWTIPATEPQRETAASRLYKSYRVWAQENGHRPVASNTFGERMKALGKGARHTKVGGFYPVELATQAIGDEGDEPVTNPRHP